jgi:hypothetical protein
VNVAPSQDPDKESRLFALVGVACGLVGLVLWFVAIAGIGFSARGLILSSRLKNSNRLTASIVGLIVSVGALAIGLLDKS